MGIENVKQGKLIYHLTKLSNLDSILELVLLPREGMLKKIYHLMMLLIKR